MAFANGTASASGLGEKVDFWFHPERQAAALDIMPDFGHLMTLQVLMMAAYTGLELTISLAMGKKVYNLRQTINTFANALFPILHSSTLIKFAYMAAYAWVYKHYALVDWTPERNWWMHVLAFFGHDFLQYLLHRSLHECNIGWAAHIIHHQAPEYNVLTAIRQSITESNLFIAAFLPLAFVIPPQIYYAHHTYSLLHQTFTHVGVVGKLWWPIEAVFVTPSHHRVHHSRNYGRKNYGGNLIIWDRMFGTFMEEKETRRPLFGIDAQPIVQGTYNPFYHQFHFFISIYKMIASGKVSAWKACFSRITVPGIENTYSVDTQTDDGKPGSVGAKPATGAKPAAKREAFDPDFPWEKRPLGPLDLYGAVQLLITTVAILGYLETVASLSTPYILLGYAASCWAITCVGWIIGAKPEAIKNEMARLVVVAALALYLPGALASGALPPQAALLASKVASKFGLSVAQLCHASVALSAASFALVASQLPSASKSTDGAKKAA